MLEQDRQQRMSEAAGALSAVTAVAAETLGIPAGVLAEVRKLARENGAGMVEILIQKKVLPEAELL